MAGTPSVAPSKSMDHKEEPGGPSRRMRSGARASKGWFSMNDLTIYDTFAERWWQAGSPLQLLARMNPARFAYFDPLVHHWAGLRVLDVGCGGPGHGLSSVARREGRGAGPVAGVPARCGPPDPPAWVS